MDLYPSQTTFMPIQTWNLQRPAWHHCLVICLFFFFFFSSPRNLLLTRLRNMKRLVPVLRGARLAQPAPTGSCFLPASWWDSHHPSSRQRAAHTTLLSAGQKSIKFPPTPAPLLFPPTPLFFILCSGRGETLFLRQCQVSQSSFPSLLKVRSGEATVRLALISNRSPGM